MKCDGLKIAVVLQGRVVFIHTEFDRRKAFIVAV